MPGTAVQEAVPVIIPDSIHAEEAGAAGLRFFARLAPARASLIAPAGLGVIDAGRIERRLIAQLIH
jgi:hypothetical protein